MFISLLGQFAVHVWCMASAVALAKPFLPASFQVQYII